MKAKEKKEDVNANASTSNESIKMTRKKKLDEMRKKCGSCSEFERVCGNFFSKNYNGCNQPCMCSEFGDVCDTKIATCSIFRDNFVHKVSK